MKKNISLTICLFALCSPLYSDEFAGNFLSMGIEPQALGMGGAHVAFASGTTASFCNPSGLSRVNGKGVHTVLNNASLGRRAHNVAFFFNPRGDVGFGFTWLHAGIKNIDARSSSGIIIGSIEDASNGFFVSAGFSVTKSLRVGLTMKNFNQTISEVVTNKPSAASAKGNGHGFDIGVQYEAGRHVSLGISVQNIKTALNWKVQRGDKSSSNRDVINSLIVLGVGYKPTNSLSLAIDAKKDNSIIFYSGASWEISKLLDIRVGLSNITNTQKTGSFSSGFSIKPMRNKKLILHYAFVEDPVGAGIRTLIGMESNF